MRILVRPRCFAVVWLVMASGRVGCGHGLVHFLRWGQVEVYAAKSFVSGIFRRGSLPPIF